jgi:hypothetical protein
MFVWELACGRIPVKEVTGGKRSAVKENDSLPDARFSSSNVHVIENYVEKTRQTLNEKTEIGASTFQGASAVTDNGTRAPNTSYFARRYTSKRQQHPQKRVLTKQHRQERTCSLNQCSRAVDLKPHHIIISENYIHE